MVWRKNDDLFKEALNIKGQLFGRQRLPLGRVGKLLKEEFPAKCFYCKIPLPTGGQVDHVLPWSISPIDGVANLVVSCTKCNNSKSYNLPALKHVDRALKRNRAKLEKIATAVESEVEDDRVIRAARNLYFRASAWGRKCGAQGLNRNSFRWISRRHLMMACQWVGVAADRRMPDQIYDFVARRMIEIRSYGVGYVHDSSVRPRCGWVCPRRRWCRSSST